MGTEDEKNTRNGPSGSIVPVLVTLTGAKGEMEMYTSCFTGARRGTGEGEGKGEGDGKGEEEEEEDARCVSMRATANTAANKATHVANAERTRYHSLCNENILYEGAAVSPMSCCCCCGVSRFVSTIVLFRAWF